MKTLFYDIETYGHDFNADTGFVMVISYKWKGEKKVTTITRNNPTEWTKKLWNDKTILQQFIPVFTDADLVVTWNGRSFDQRFLQTRMLKHRLGYLPPVPHEDGLLTARRTLKMRRSLENMGKFFNLKTPKERMDLETVWFPAAAGNPIALKQVIKRCESDVLLLEEAYNLVAPMSRVHPNVAVINGKIGGCPRCGAEGFLQKRGKRVAVLHQEGRIQALRHYRIRYHCQNCGAWSSSNPIKNK